MQLRRMFHWRRVVLFTHRWMGIAFGLLFLAWFVSGIAFMYWGMPNLSAGERMDRQAQIDLSAASVSPAQAALGNNLRPSSLRLEMRGDRPVYRFGAISVYADSGERVPVSPADADEAVQIVREWVPEHAATVHHDRLLQDSDQWTLQNAQRSRMPLHRVAVGDSRDTYYYVSARDGELVMKTDRESRLKGFASGVLHWMYFVPLRKNGYLWNQFIIWGSFAGALMCLLGLVLGLSRLSLAARFRHRGQPSRSPYSGVMRWHHYTGLVFGLVTFTWILSGAFSVNPFGMFSGGSGLNGAQRELVTGGSFQVEPIELEALQSAVSSLAEHFPVKQADVLQFRGELYLVAGRPPSAVDPLPQEGPPERRMISLADPAQGTFTRFELAAMEEIADHIMPGVPVRDRMWLQEYDNYYRSRTQARPLPVLRVRYLDEQRTWLYFDPHSGGVAVQHRTSRAQRWLYGALHHLDIPFLYDRRPLWDIVVISLSIGGIVLSASTLWPGFKRVGRNLVRFALLLTGLAARRRATHDGGGVRGRPA